MCLASRVRLGSNSETDLKPRGMKEQKMRRRIHFEGRVRVPDQAPRESYDVALLAPLIEVGFSVVKTIDATSSGTPS